MKLDFPKKPDNIITLRDTILVEDPFGLGFTFEIYRADHERLRRWDEAHPESGFSKIHTRGALAQAMAGGRTDQARIVDELASKIEQRGDGIFMSDMGLAVRKMALVGIASWGGVTSGGVELKYDPLIALELLGFRGYGWKTKGAAEWTIKTDAEFEKMRDTSTGKAVLAKLEGKNSHTIDVVQRFEGEMRDEDGNVWVAPRERMVNGKLEHLPHGGHPLGQSLTLFLHAESLNASAMMAKSQLDDQDAFQPTPDSDTGSGTSTEPSEPDSLSEPSEESSAAPTAE